MRRQVPSKVEGVRERLAEIFRRCSPDLHRYVRKRLRGSNETADLTQEIFERFIRGDWRARAHNPYAYLFGIASNVVADAKMAQQRGTLFFVSDIRIDVAAEIDEAIARDFDAILQQQMQREELLLQVGSRSWILLTPDKQDAEVRARARTLHERIGEIYGEIGDGSPALEVLPMGIWRLPGQTAALVARFKRSVDTKPLRRRAS